MRNKQAAIFFVLLVLMSCQKSTPTSVPRKEGYPRILEYGGEFVTTPKLPIDFLINKQATFREEVKPDKSVWLTIKYPAYSATVFCTFTPVDSEMFDQVIANRMERIGLNLGNAVADLDDFESANGFHCSVITAFSNVSCPLQFLADNDRWVISGAVILENLLYADVDFITPIVEKIASDLEYALQNL